jgi:hypothetical protein
MSPVWLHVEVVLHLKSRRSNGPALGKGSRKLLMASPAQERASGALAERRCYIWEVESPSAKVAESDKFRCSGVPFRQAMSLRPEPKFKFIIGAEHSEDLRLRLGVCVGNRSGSIHNLR